MADEIDIRHGGLVVVDTENLRDVARILASAAERATASADRVRWAGGLLLQSAAAVPSWEAADRADAAADRLHRLGGDLADLGQALVSAAASYEAVELRAQWAAAAPGDRAGIEAALRAALADSPAAWLAGAPLTAIFAVMDAEELRWRSASSAPLRDALDAAASPFDALAALHPALGPGFGASGALASAAVMMQLGLGRIGLASAHGPLRGTGDPVRVNVQSHPAAAAPAGLAQALARVPGGADGRVRVERYDLPSGEREWVVYITGTQESAPGEAFDWNSNAQLYPGDRSASYEAVVAALADAGRAPGEQLHVVGHSQGAMIGASLAEVDAGVRTIVTAGTPVSPTVGEGVLAVDLRHRDDPVAALSAHGSATGTGSSDSIVVTRTVPGLSSGGLLEAHALTAYVETAAMVDASADPRVDALRDVWRRLGTAQGSSATVYTAERGVSPGAEASG